jgi:uncharacterized membrane protein (DUF4010 family)
MDGIDLFQRLTFAVAIGVIVGIERHWRERDEQQGRRTAGIRTFSLIGMLGGVTGLLAKVPGFEPLGAAIVIAGLFMAFAAIFARYQYREAVADNNFSVTTTVAAMLTFALGTLAVIGNLTLASAAGVAMVAILASRDLLHGFVQRLTWPELRSAVVLLSMTFVILPLLPDRPLGPFGGVSPAKTWLLVVVLAAISYCGYIAVRLLGSARGELVAGAIGGLISSTATTLTNARQSTADGNPRTLASGALAACAVSYLRTAVLIGLLAAPLGRLLFFPLGAACLTMVAFAWIFARDDEEHTAKETPKNPFDLDSVIKMALMLTVVAFLARAAASIYGSSGLIAVSALSGLADVDAAVIAVTGMTAQLSESIAVAAIATAVISNSISKAAYAVVFGSGAFGARFLLASAAALVVGVLAYWLEISIDLFGAAN